MLFALKEFAVWAGGSGGGQIPNHEMGHSRSESTEEEVPCMSFRRKACL